MSDPTHSATSSPAGLTGVTPEAQDAAPEAGPRPGNALIAASTALAWIAVSLAVVSLVILAIPVHNRPIQDCGMPGVYLLRGTPNASLYDSAGEPRAGLSESGLRRAYENRCSKQVGSRAWPAALTGSGFFLLGLLAWLLAYLGRRRLADEALARWLIEQAQA